MSPELKLLSIDEVFFDQENPRIAMALEMYYKGKITQEQVFLALNDSADRSESGTTVQTLKDSIKSTGGITQPIIVNCVDGKYTVIEGNTRLMIYKEYLKKGVTGNWNNIPAIVYENMSEEQKHSVRLQSHIVGPRAWNPYSKAKYLKKLRDEDLMSTERIIDLCGGKKQEIMEMIAAYDDMEEYYRPKAGDNFDPRQFSAFRELNSGKKRQSALMASGYTKDDFAQWVVDGKIGEATNVRKLPDVLNDKKLCDTFIKSDLKEAILNIRPSEKIVDLDISTLTKSLITKIGNLQWQQADAIRHGDSSDMLDDLVILQNLLSQLVSDDPNY